MLNQAIVQGRIMRDPVVVLKEWKGKSFYAGKYCLVCTRDYQKEGKQNADLIWVSVLGKQAEFTRNFLKKGTKVMVTGRIQSGSYLDGKGNKIYTTELLAKEHHFWGDKKKDDAPERQKTVPQDPTYGFTEEELNFYDEYVSMANMKEYIPPEEELFPAVH